MEVAYVLTQYSVMMRGNPPDPATPAASANDRNSRSFGPSPDNGHEHTRGGDRNYGQRGNRRVEDMLRGEISKHKDDAQRERSKNNHLRRENTRIQNQQRLSNKEYNELEAEANEVKRRYDYILNKVIHPYARERNLRYDDRTTKSIDTTLRPLFLEALEYKKVKERHLASQDEIQTLRAQLQTSQGQKDDLQRQVQSLQKQILARVDKVQAVSDDQLNQDFRSLAALVKSLSRSIRVTEHMDILGVLEPQTLHGDVAEHHWATRARKKYYIEAWIWSVLIQWVFSSPFAIFHETGQGLSTSWGDIFGDRHEEGWPSPSPSSETWRYTTMEQLVDQVGRPAITKGQVDQVRRGDRVEAMKQNVMLVREEVANIIGGKVSTLSPTVDLSRVPMIVDKAFSLAVDMSLQRSRLQVTWPWVGDLFAEGQMSCLSDPDGDDMVEGVVAFTVSPGLTKWGDANGNNFDQRYDIVPSLVHLEPATSMGEVQHIGDLEERIEDVEDPVYTGFAGSGGS